MKPLKLLACCMLCLAFVAGCDDDDTDNPVAANPEEVITTVDLTFTPVGGGPVATAQFRDPDGDGGNAPTITGLTLDANSAYILEINLLNETVPASDPEHFIGDEIAEEAEEHQFFFEGTALNGLMTVAYDDVESDYAATATAPDLPVGLRNSVNTSGAGTGTFTVILKHLPPVNGQPVKVAGVDTSVGETDVEVTFQTTIQ